MKMFRSNSESNPNKISWTQIVNAIVQALLSSMLLILFFFSFFLPTGHKGMLGPQGTGGMYVGEGVEIRPFKSGGTGVQTFNKRQPEEMPVRLEAGTLNGHGIAGLLAGVEYLEKTGIDTIREREQMLMRRFYIYYMRE